MTDTLYSINGVNMGRASANPYGWAIMRAGTSQLGGITKALNKVEVPGYDGYFPGPSTRTDQILVFNIRSPRQHVETLLALLSTPGYDANFPTLGSIQLNTASGKAAYFELASAIPQSDYGNDEIVTVTATLNIPAGAWRDTSATVTDVSITTNPQVVTSIGSGISLPIADAEIFISGDVGTMQITDSAGSWLRTTSAYTFASGSGLLYQGSTGRAYRATTGSPWTPTADLGFAVDVSGGGFRMTPYFDFNAPATRSARLTVLSTLLSSVAIKVRWRGSYALK